MDRVRILCKTCDGIGYTYRKVMTPAQSKQAAAIMQKHGVDGWRIENHHGSEIGPWKPVADPWWNWIYQVYRAVRIERTPTRTPLPIEHYKRGMEVKSQIGLGEVERLVVGLINGCIILETADLTHAKMVSHWRWPNETEWHPAYTETVEERVVETLIVEGL